MDDYAFMSLMSLMMCSDPWPTSNQDDYKYLNALLNRESIRRGYCDWVDAYHRFEPKKRIESVEEPNPAIRDLKNGVSIGQIQADLENGLYEKGD